MNRTIELVKTIYEIKQLEECSEVQIALAGRSNVGKSSLVNRLAGRKALAKISSKPGKTRSLNYYRVNPDGYYLVDLPGYGYAKCSKTERDKWAKLIAAYMNNNPQLKAVAVLLDSRLTPQKIDMELTAYLRSLGIPVIPVLTKADKSKQRELAQLQNQWKDILQQERLPILFSSKTGKGEDKLWDTFSEYAGMPSDTPEP
ncbi:MULTISPECIES: ribosome biogenesis GTP-binding protein YihA/YsxC [unclassified Pseudodesulfovibrio]|uniref:ribosome biogenesis GTP-binding protein YihA/YsxC n=1 Tax=unclassified Pseudodesulfovibrio TaxID=2661612 RepID=UPI000FEC00C8|nr:MULTISPECIES: ribosome biogenesis GTP-binding protein YihA/YsxC [unclassified Pseudodesulfovibrio]MCJ2163823.1 ribosome biogenesis GTP-binding protein YihA/YsxC [Pseudodesulfovibrio sp. S3-i]RWU05930.1 YihA family ribosome biogenesis GTP-binding protein [Pseudodesulfovibrio sp. S3]